MDVVLLGDFHRVRAVEGFKEAIALRRQVDFQRIHNIRLVIADQNVVHIPFPLFLLFLPVLYHRKC